MNTDEFQSKAKRLKERFSVIAEDLGVHFSRTEARDVAANYLKSLLSRVERKNSWQMAEAVGKPNPYGFQNLLGRAVWDEDVVRDEHVQRVMNFLGSDHGVLAIDESGFLKKGTKSAGVGRQYSGTAGKVENCQIGVYLSWKTKKGHTLLDRELYLPEDWVNDRERCKVAGIADPIEFQTKTELAHTMLKRIFALGVAPSWVVADEVYGRDSKLRNYLEDKKVPYVMAVPSNQVIAVQFEKVPIIDFIKSAPKAAWQKLSAGTGSKGPRLYEWALLKINHPFGEEYQRWALYRRSLSDPTDVVFYLVFAPSQTSIQDIVLAWGARWTIEECFESAKGEVGLDHYEVRSYRGWYRHMTLVMIAHSILVISRAETFPPSLKKNTMTKFKKKRGL